MFRLVKCSHLARCNKAKDPKACERRRSKRGVLKRQVGRRLAFARSMGGHVSGGGGGEGMFFHWMGRRGLCARSSRRANREAGFWPLTASTTLAKSL